MSSENIADTSTWLPLDGLEPGFDENRAPFSSALDGTELVATTVTGEPIRYSFVPSSEQSYEVFDVADGLFYVQMRKRASELESTSLFIDQTNGCGLRVIATVGKPGAGIAAVQHRFKPFTIDGAETTGPLPHASNDLIGRRAYWRYSKEHAYEHVYLSPQWYTWHCLAGPEKGLADTDECTTYKLRDDIYVFTWREKVIPCGSVIVTDHRDHNNLRSHGYLFGMDETGTKTVHFTFGAFGKVLNEAKYPADLDPAL